MKRKMSIPDQIVSDFIALPAINEQSIHDCYECYFEWCRLTFNWLNTIHPNPDEIEDIKYLFIAVCKWWGNYFQSTINLYYLEQMGVDQDV